MVMTPLNEDIAAAGTAEKLAEVEEAIRTGALQVFDTATFTVGGEEVTASFALDTDGDFTPDSEEAVFDGAYHESYFQSAPYFALQIDGIEWLNSRSKQFDPIPKGGAASAARLFHCRTAGRRRPGNSLAVPGEKNRATPLRRARGFDTIGKEAFQRYGAVPLTGSGAGPGTERMTPWKLSSD